MRQNLEIGPRFIMRGKQHDVPRSFTQKAGQWLKSPSFRHDAVTIPKLLRRVWVTSKGLSISMKTYQIKHDDFYRK